MKERVKLVVVIPVGPINERYQLDDVLDTISSVIYYTDSSRKIIIQDNSVDPQVSQTLANVYPELMIIQSPQNYGLSGGLYKAESMAFLFASAAYEYEVLVRMDIDALMIGHGLADDAARIFREQPTIGELGTYMVGTNGEISEFSWPSNQLAKEVSRLGWLQDRERCEMLRMLVEKASANGYVLGEHIIGGVAIFNPVLISKLIENGYLMREELRRSVLQVDHIFSLLVKAVGMELGEYGGPEHPVANRWKGLPAHPETLVSTNKKIIHSTRFWEDMKEPEIRAYFRSLRTETSEALRA